LADLWI
jgi:hypothetical protein